MTSLQEWADHQIADAEALVRDEDQFTYIEWRKESELVGDICIEKRENVLYMISFMLDDSIQKNGVFKSFAAFIPSYARQIGCSQLAVISANAIMRDLLVKCGFERGQDPDDYFVDISKKDSAPEKYGLAKP